MTPTPELTKERIAKMKELNAQLGGPSEFSYEGVTDGWEFDALCDLAEEALDRREREKAAQGVED